MTRRVTARRSVSPAFSVARSAPARWSDVRGDRRLDRRETERPVVVELGIRDADDPPAPDRHPQVPRVVVLERAWRLARPVLVVLGAIDLHEDPRRHPSVEPTDARQLRLRREPDADIPQPQPHVGLAPGIREPVDEPPPGPHSRRRPGEHRIETLDRPSPVAQQSVTAGDRDHARLPPQHAEERLLVGGDPVRGCPISAGRVHPIDADAVAGQQPLAPLAGAAQPRRGSRHRDIHRRRGREEESAGTERRHPRESAADPQSAYCDVAHGRQRIPPVAQSEHGVRTERGAEVSVGESGREQVASAGDIPDAGEVGGNGVHRSSVRGCAARGRARGRSRGIRSPPAACGGAARPKTQEKLSREG